MERQGHGEKICHDDGNSFHDLEAQKIVPPGMSDVVEHTQKYQYTDQDSLSHMYTRLESLPGLFEVFIWGSEPRVYQQGYPPDTDVEEEADR